VSSRRFSDPEAVAKGLAALGGADRLQITGYGPDPSIQGLRLDEIARRKGETAVDMYIEMMANGGARVIGHTMKVEDVNRFAASPLVMVCSDGGIGSAHPRGAGTFPRVLGYYVRDESVLSLELAIQKMTSMPAHRLGLESRGRIEPGAIADLTAFDPATVADNSTFEQPHLLSTGIEKVWVAGRLAWNGNPTDERAGQVLRRR
jgi:N-acyl-D-aspartate/D-glutamate deacylase